MAEIARHVGGVDQLSLRQFEKSSQQIRFIDFINTPRGCILVVSWVFWKLHITS